MPWSNNTKICCPLLLFPGNIYQPPAFLNNHPDVDPVKLMLDADKITSAIGLYSEIGGGAGTIVICQNDINVDPKWMTHQLYIKRSSINEFVLAEHKAVIDTRAISGQLRIMGQSKEAGGEAYPTEEILKEVRFKFNVPDGLAIIVDEYETHGRQRKLICSSEYTVYQLVLESEKFQLDFKLTDKNGKIIKQTTYIKRDWENRLYWDNCKYLNVDDYIFDDGVAFDLVPEDDDTLVPHSQPFERIRYDEVLQNISNCNFEDDDLFPEEDAEWLSTIYCDDCDWMLEPMDPIE